MRDGAITVALCGDVMLGRGVDQILPHPGDPELREGYVRDARTYVELAEAVNGAIPRPVDFTWPWGSALEVLDEAAPDVRLLNLETSVTADGTFAEGKSVHYRMSPANLPCLQVARPDVCTLANNHVLDFGPAGLAETVTSMSRAGLPTVGAGASIVAARRPAVVGLRGGGRVVVLGFGLASSGIPDEWAATAARPGVHLLADLSATSEARVLDQVRAVRQPGDVVVVSVHWGSNWGYDVPRAQVRFAHALIDGGVDLVHGHSSHHVRPLEVHRDRLVIHGCGDFIDDYEGIAGHESYRSDLRILFLVSVEPGTGRLVGARLVPFQARAMRLRHASAADARWLLDLLGRVSRGFGSRFHAGPGGEIVLGV